MLTVSLIVRKHECAVGDPIRADDGFLCDKKSYAKLHEQLRIESQIDRLPGSRSRKLSHVRFPWCHTGEIVVGPASFLRVSSRDQSVADDAVHRVDITGVIEHSWEVGPHVRPLGLPVDPRHVPSVKHGGVVPVIESQKFSAHRGHPMLFDDPLLVPLIGSHRRWLPRHAVPSNTIARRFDPDLEAIIVADHEQNLEDRQTCHRFLYLDEPRVYYIYIHHLGDLSKGYYRR